MADAIKLWGGEIAADGPAKPAHGASGLREPRRAAEPNKKPLGRETKGLLLLLAER